MTTHHSKLSPQTSVGILKGTKRNSSTHTHAVTHAHTLTCTHKHKHILSHSAAISRFQWGFPDSCSLLHEIYLCCFLDNYLSVMCCISQFLSQAIFNKYRRSCPTCGQSPSCLGGPQGQASRIIGSATCISRASAAAQHPLPLSSHC